MTYICSVGGLRRYIVTPALRSGLTLQRLQALARLDVPDLDSGVCVAWDQDVVFELHAAGEGLMSC